MMVKYKQKYTQTDTSNVINVYLLPYYCQTLHDALHDLYSDTDQIWSLIKKRTKTDSDVKYTMLQTDFDQSQLTPTWFPEILFWHHRTHTDTHIITHTHKVADGCALHTGRTAGTDLGKREGPLLPAKTKTRICAL